LRSKIDSEEDNKEIGESVRRRDFLKATLISVTSGEMFLSALQKARNNSIKKTKISLVKTTDRKAGIKTAIELLGINPVKDKNVLIKPNFNTSDPCPGSTHNDTLEGLILISKDYGAKKISIGERCGFAGLISTDKVFQEKGIYELCNKYGVRVINFDELEERDWIKFKPHDSHWAAGFKIARPMIDTECVISTCCLKTHRFGGVFTMSLKLSVGAVKKSYMTELHTSFFNMRNMIAEINLAYNPSLILLDGIDAFVDGGPDKGVVKKGNVILAGTDRVAIDAVGVAILKELGSNKEIMNKRIFEHDQIKRAVEIGLGISSAEDIEFVTGDDESRRYSEKIQEILLRG